MDTRYKIHEAKDDVDEIRMDLSSPRTLEACLEMGVLEKELAPRSFEMRPGETAEMVKRREEWYERRRIEKVELVTKRRNEIVARQEQERTRSTTRLDALSLGSAVTKLKSPNDTLSPHKKMPSSTLLEYEAKRIEAAKKRQEREIQHMLQGEQKMSQLQSKLLQHEKEAQLRLQEHLARLQKSRAKMKEKLCERLQKNKETADAEYKLALEMAEKERQKDLLRIQEEEKQKEMHKAFIKQRDAERLCKLRERELRSKQALEHIEKKAEASQLEMERREKMLEAHMQQKKELKRQQLAEKQQEASIRIARALEHHRERRKRDRELFHQRQKESEVRAKQKYDEALTAAKKQKEKRDLKEKDRQERLIAAVEARKQRRAAIVADRKRREQFYHEVYSKRYQVNQLQKLDHQLDIQARLDNVERIRRVDEYKRLKLLCKLKADKERTLNVRQAKQELVDQRKNIAKVAFLRKHKIREAVEHMRITNKYTSIDALVDLSDLPKTRLGSSNKNNNALSPFGKKNEHDFEHGNELPRSESTSALLN